MTDKRPPDDADTEDVPSPAETIAKAVAESVGEDRDAMVYVARYSEEAGGYRHIRKYRPDEFDVDTIRQQFGGGRFQARVRNGAGEWMKGSRTFEIEGKPRVPDPDDEADELAARFDQLQARLDSKGDGNDQTQWMMRMMMELVTKMSQPAPAPAFDPMQFATAMADASARSAAQLADLVGLRNEMNKGGDDFERMMEVFRMGMDMAKENEGGYASVVGPLAGVLARALDGDRVQPAQPVMGPAPSAPPSPQQPEPMSYQQTLAQAIALLAPAAQSGSQNPEAWADIVEEQLPDVADALAHVAAQVGGPEALLEMVAQRDQRVASHREFFARVVDYLLDEGDDEEEEGTEVGAQEEGADAT